MATWTTSSAVMGSMPSHSTSSSSSAYKPQESPEQRKVIARLAAKIQRLSKQRSITHRSTPDEISLVLEMSCFVDLASINVYCDCIGGKHENKTIARSLALNIADYHHNSVDDAKACVLAAVNERRLHALRMMGDDATIVDLRMYEDDLWDRRWLWRSPFTPNGVVAMRAMLPLQQYARSVPYVSDLSVIGNIMVNYPIESHKVLALAYCHGLIDSTEAADDVAATSLEDLQQRIALFL